MEDFNGNTAAFPSHHLVEHTAVMENYPGLSVWLGLLRWDYWFRVLETHQLRFSLLFFLCAFFCSIQEHFPFPLIVAAWFVSKEYPSSQRKSQHCIPLQGVQNKTHFQKCDQMVNSQPPDWSGGQKLTILNANGSWFRLCVFWDNLYSENIFVFALH